MRKWVTILFSVLTLPAFSNDAKIVTELNKANSPEYLSGIEKDILNEINLFRSNPAKYADTYITPLTKYYLGNILHYPGKKPIKTHEGVKALEECVRILKNTSPLPILYPSEGLSKAANDHVRDQSDTGKTGHKGSDHSGFKERIERYGEWELRIAENIAYGGSSPREIVILLLIDDGVRDRGHRNTFLHPDLKTIGISYGPHPKFETMCVMDFAGSFKEKGK
jgi:uncharacterized protein YkwD